MIGWLTSLWRNDRRLRRYLLVIDVGLVAFSVFAIIYIIDHPADKGSDGFEFLAGVPFLGIAALFTLPAMLFLIWNRTLRVSAVGTLFAIGLNAVIWSVYLTSGIAGSEWKCVTFYELCKRGS